MLHTAFIILISQDSREPFPMWPTACRVSSPIFLVVFFFTPTQSTITVLFLDYTGKMNIAWNLSHSSLRSANGLAKTPLLLRKPCYAWFNFACYHPPRAIPGTSPALRARGWGIVWNGFVPGVGGRGKSKITRFSCEARHLLITSQLTQWRRTA